ncbi:hypothetical protein KC711_00995 [Candidatus Peregrinibacteria bacterium]|nr:hypothetical protein [Candidatus Peregrinibacteria bacterium]MCB9805428.1 hypothetical protein [Candidatus Peribacteria bacterium]
MTLVSYNEFGRNIGTIVGLKASAHAIQIVRNGQNGICDCADFFVVNISITPIILPDI